MAQTIEGGTLVAHHIGENAGKVWTLLREKGELAPSALSKSLQINASDLDRALGWLAREDKLTFSASNVAHTIGENAGKIWRLLKEGGDMTPSSIAKALKLRMAEVDHAIGWLARENKLNLGSEGNGSSKLSLRDK